jgi:hypothetical protein
MLYSLDPIVYLQFEYIFTYDKEDLPKKKK